MISIADNFSYNGSKPLDNRMQFSNVANMKAYAEASLYNGCLAYITGTKEYYTYDSSNTVDATTGRWRIFESGGGGASSLNDLSDVTISSATSGQVLKNNGSGWVNGDVPTDATRQPKTLDTPLTIDGSSVTTVEGALGALNNRSIANIQSKNLDVNLASVNCITEGQTVFYTWKYVTGESVSNTYGLPEITISNIGEYSFYDATIVVSAGTNAASILVFYSYKTTSVSDNPRKALYKIAMKNATKELVWSIDTLWHFPSSNVLSSSEFDYTEDSFDPLDYAIPDRTTVFSLKTETLPSGTLPYMPIKQANSRYTYIMSYEGMTGSYGNIFVYCLVTLVDSNGIPTGTNSRLFFNVYNYIGGTWGFGAWSEIGGSVDTTKIYTTDDTAETTLADGDYFPFQDVSASAKRKTLWSNVKSVLKTYFDTLYSTVKTRGTAISGGTDLSLVNTGDMYAWNNKQDALTAGTNISITGNTISATNTISLNFSTSEQAVGKWTDNSTLYQRTFTGTLSTTQTTITVFGTSLKQTETLVTTLGVGKLKGVAYGSYVLKGGYEQFIPCSFQISTVNIAVYQDDAGKVYIAYIGTNHHYDGGTYYVTLLYTK